jgi:hypothetical protein
VLRFGAALVIAIVDINAQAQSKSFNRSDLDCFKAF